MSAFPSQSGYRASRLSSARDECGSDARSRDSCAVKYFAAFSYMASTQRLLLQALLKGMGHAVRRNDELAMDRYCRRLALIARHFDTNPPVSDALERLLSAGGQWLATTVAKRYEAEQQVLEHIECVMDLFRVSADVLIVRPRHRNFCTAARFLSEINLPRRQLL